MRQRKKAMSSAPSASTLYISQQRTYHRIGARSNGRQDSTRHNVIADSTKGQRTMETWKPIKDYEGLYEVSNYGNVRSLPRATTSGKMLKQYTHKNGYKYVNLCKNNISKTKRVHVLVVKAFTGHNANGFDPNAVIDHIDGNKGNNRLDNLEVVTQKENDTRARAMKKQRTNGKPVIDLTTMKVYGSYTEASHAIGGRQGELVKRVCDGKRSHYRNHKFARLEDYENNTIPAYGGKTQRKASASLWR